MEGTKSFEEPVAAEEAIESEPAPDYATKLAEYITGLKPEDPRIIERLIEDQKIIRAKYGLPPRESSRNPGEYEHFLRELAQKLNVTINETSDCGQFFQEYRNASGVHFDGENRIGASIDRNDFNNYLHDLNVLEHELIHAIQSERSPRMSIELMEYEAYIAGGNNESLRESPESVRLVFGVLIGSSVEHWYKQQSTERGEKVTPAWEA